MSKIAGILLLIYGGATAYLGFNEITHRSLLTPVASYWTTGIGVVLVLVGLAHFKAPHKAFLASVLLLLCFHVQMYFNALFFFARPMWPYQLSLLSVSLLILLFSHLGYSRKAKAAG
jgi:hypothetical protein